MSDAPARPADSLAAPPNSNQWDEIDTSQTMDLPDNRLGWAETIEARRSDPLLFDTANET